MSLAETKSKHQRLDEPPRNKTVSKYMLTFTFAYKNVSAMEKDMPVVGRKAM